MNPLNLPAFAHVVEERNGKSHIFDGIRKKWLALTPEEWVRQHMVNYLVAHLGYSRGLIRLEGGLKYNGLARRSDVLVYNRRGTPHMLVECKAPQVKIAQAVFEQAAQYNKVLGAPYLAVTNGLLTYCCQVNQQTGNYTFLEALPPATG